MDNSIQVKVIIKVETDISFWNALKLRLAGGQAIREFIATKVAETNQTIGQEQRRQEMIHGPGFHC